MAPIKVAESNFCFLGPTREIADLPCHIQGENTFAIFEPTAEERKLIADGGHIRLGIHGIRPIPPVSLAIVSDLGPYRRLPAPCDVCGKDAEDPIHLSGDGTHAYRFRGPAQT